MKGRTIISGMVLASACLLGGGCAIEHLGDRVGVAFQTISNKQTTVPLTDLDAPTKMTAEDAKVAQENKKQDRKRGQLGSSGGPRVLNLAR